MSRLRVVAALGGNALLKRGERPDAVAQRRNIERAIPALAELAEQHEVIVTHGNGPQVGLLALQASAYSEVDPYPLDILGAESEGMVGYMLEQALRNRLPGREVATVLTQVVVDAEDVAFTSPTKPIGPVYEPAVARRVAAANGWSLGRDGDGFRRVVASPDPLEIVELRSIELLLAGGVLPICAGGGGVPVVRDGDGELLGVEAVVDKDLAAALLGAALDADALLILTEVEGVLAAWGTPDARVIPQATAGELRALGLPAGSMGPKVEAAARFIEKTGGRAVIGALDDAARLLDGSAGTAVVRSGDSRSRSRVLETASREH